MKNCKCLLSFVLISLLCGPVLCGPARAQNGPAPAVPLAGAAPAEPSLDVERQSVTIAVKGDAAAKKGDWPTAQADYRQALALWPDDMIALYGMAEYSQSAGDTAGAISYSRAAIYTHPAPPALPVIREGNPYLLMEYVLRLSQAGQEEEAVSVYNYAANLLNYRDGRQYLKVLLPQFGPAAGQWAYTLQRLQAMAHVGYAIDYGSFDKEGCLKRLQQAVALVPDSAVTYFYRARHEYAYKSDTKGARADYERARQLGDATVGAAVDQAEKVLR